MNRDEFMDLVGADYVDEHEKAQLSQEDATIVAKSKRTFVELLVHYPHPDVCTYPEYKGKPYYSIKYIEDGECFVGFGTYKPEVLSQYLRDYFMPSAQPEERTDKRTETRACDLISRQAAIDACHNWNDGKDAYAYGYIVEERLQNLPPAQPERKNGKWVRNDNGTYSCDKCRSWIPEEQHHYARYCLHCGADMRSEKENR